MFTTYRYSTRFQLHPRTPAQHGQYQFTEAGNQASTLGITDTQAECGH